LSSEHSRVWLFLGPTNTRLKTDLALAMHEMGERLVPVRMRTSGKNALDFHIAYYLGFLIKEDPNGTFHIVSMDNGFDPLIQHLRDRHISIRRVKSIAAMRAPQSKKKPGTSPDSADESRLLEKFIATLGKRKTSNPGTLKALRSTIRSDCGRDLPERVIDSVYNAVLRMDCVKVEGNKIQFTGR